MKEIKKKIAPKYFKDVAEGKKNFEIRKDDSDYEIGDTLILQECYQEAIPFSHNSKGEPITQTIYTGNEITKRIKYILRDCPQYGLQEGYCILGLEDIEPKNKQEFQLGDTAYMIDEDYRYFEPKDIGDWVFTSELYREMHMQNIAESEE
jgi:hypothetical protein